MIRAFHHYFSSRKLALFLVETSAIAIASWIGAAVTALAAAPARGGLQVGEALPALAATALAFVATFQLAIYLSDLYDLRVATEDRSRGVRVLRAVGIAALMMGLTMMASRFNPPEGALLGGATGAILGTVLVRIGLRGVVGEPERILIVGNGKRARWLAKAAVEQGEFGFEVCGMIEPRRDSNRGSGEERIDEIAARLDAQYVVLASEDPRGSGWSEELLRCRIAGRRVYDIAGFCERVLRRIPVLHLRASDLAFADELSISNLRRISKRACDIVAATALLALAAPLMVLVALAIKLDSPGPVFYRQERIGKDGKPFWLWKFRSMARDAEANGAMWARENDGRATRVGKILRKARIDEVPQAFNVLFGEMSFVGPRPERPVFVAELKNQIPFYELRELVRPGITGWAQIRYSYGASVEDARNKLEFDLYYLRNGSLFLDLMIIFHTFRHVLLGRGAR
jgi:sugar transferase (PEP-CTERM system associated)